LKNKQLTYVKLKENEQI